MEKRVHGADEMGDFASNFVGQLQTEKTNATVVALSGELGAGKTTFAQAAARALGVEETVNSPTFVIEKVYSLSRQKWQRLIHIDAYRLKNVDELRSLGWGELLRDSSNIIIIEWPENVPGAIPEVAQKISIQIGEDDERTISYGD